MRLFKITVNYHVCIYVHRMKLTWQRTCIDIEMLEKLFLNAYLNYFWLTNQSRVVCVTCDFDFWIDIDVDYGGRSLDDHEFLYIFNRLIIMSLFSFIFTFTSIVTTMSVIVAMSIVLFSWFTSTTMSRISTNINPLVWLS